MYNTSKSWQYYQSFVFITTTAFFRVVRVLYSFSSGSSAWLQDYRQSMCVFFSIHYFVRVAFLHKQVFFIIFYGAVAQCYPLFGPWFMHSQSVYSVLMLVNFRQNSMKSHILIGRCALLQVHNFTVLSRDPYSVFLRVSAVSLMAQLPGHNLVCPDKCAELYKRTVKKLCAT